ncbi:MAG: hypothetical protein GVY36_16980 [Verrucomicrobia bacterium]|jgi:hypothetical protein|nr:hypothetical protein [Verrucomicrobiota bacterium]
MSPISPKVEEQLQHLINEVRASDALVVLGAGASFHSGMPMAGQLASLVWHTIEEHPDLLSKLSLEIGGHATSAKELIGDNKAAIMAAFKLIDLDSSASATFRRVFSNLNDSRLEDFSPFHEELAKLLFLRKVLGVISFNWDTLLEANFQRLYGISPNAQTHLMWKPHGDCASSGKWTLPHEPGNIPENLIQWTSEIANLRPRALLLVGYSEQDRLVVERLISPLSQKWRIFRINPNAKGEGAIQLPALTAMREISRHLLNPPTKLLWEPVTFDNQRGLEAAISGERLCQRDADACPKLPHYKYAKNSLALLHLAEIAGEPGCGKSITLWQLAREYQRKGWLVFQATQFNEGDETTALEMIRQLTWQSIIVLDDSQTYSSQFVSRLKNLANVKLKIILGTTDNDWTKDGNIRISAAASVETIAAACLKHKEVIMPIIKRFDSRIGDGYMDTRYEGRIELAKNENTPWQFFFVLRSGWQQTSLEFNSLRDFGNASHLLLVIAVQQLATLDGGLTHAELVEFAEREGINKESIEGCLKLLKSKKMILNKQHIRCLHIRTASMILKIALSRDVKSEREMAVRLVRSTLTDCSTSLRGASWLISESSFHSNSLILDLDTNITLLERAFRASSSLERRDACFVISRLLGLRGNGVRNFIKSNSPKLHSWINEAHSENAHALGSVINNLHNDDAGYCEKFIAAIPVSSIAIKLTEMNHSDGYAWGHFLGRIGCGASDKWRNEFSKEIPRKSIKDFITRCPTSEVGNIVEFIQSIAYYDFNLSLDLLELAISSISQSFSEDSIRTYRRIHDLEFWVLGRGIFGEGRPSKRQRSIEKKLFEGIDPTELANGILRSRYGDWETYSRLIHWIKQAHPRRHKEVVNKLDLDGSKVTDAQWKKPSRELRLLLWSLTMKDSNDPACGWLLKNASKIEEIDPVLTSISPDLAVNLLDRGGKVDLGGHNGNWYSKVMAIASVADTNEDSARLILRTNFEHILIGVSMLSLPDGLPMFLELVKKLDEELLLDIAKAINLSDAGTSWEKALKDHRVEERKAARGVLKIFAAMNYQPVKMLAESLLRRVRYRKAKAAD